VGDELGNETKFNTLNTKPVNTLNAKHSRYHGFMLIKRFLLISNHGPFVSLLPHLL